MAGRLLDVDPELAYEHTQAAVRRGGRIDVVREAAGIAAYRTGRFAEALSELRTVRRLNGSSEHLAIMADAERGLGRPERAIALAATPEADTLDPYSKVELAIVVSGARSDLGEHDAALLALDKLPTLKGDLRLRVLQARAAALEAAGRADEAKALLADIDPDDLERAAGNAEPDEAVVVYDVYDEEADLEDADPAEDLEGDEESDADADDEDASADGEGDLDDDGDDDSTEGGRDDAAGEAGDPDGEGKEHVESAAADAGDSVARETVDDSDVDAHELGADAQQSDPSGDSSVDGSEGDRSRAEGDEDLESRS